MIIVIIKLNSDGCGFLANESGVAKLSSRVEDQAAQAGSAQLCEQFNLELVLPMTVYYIIITKSTMVSRVILSLVKTACGNSYNAYTIR